MRLQVHEEFDRKICGAVWTSPHPRRIMDTLCYDIGPRVPGSKTMRQAQSFLADNLKQLGAGNVHTESVPVFTWRETLSQVKMVNPRVRSYQSLHHVHSAAGKLEAPLLDGGGANREDLERLGASLKGAVLLIRGHEVSGGKFEPIEKRIRHACQSGAAGILVMNMFPGTGPAIGLASISQDIPVPVLGLSYEDAREIQSFIKKDRSKVRIETGGTSYHTACANLVAKMGPARGVNEVIILSAHLDTFHVNPGAFDNLTGVVTLMEMARALAPLRAKFRRQLRLILFTGEEYGFTGSKAYVKEHAAELNHIRFIFNLDSLWPTTASGIAVMWSPEMRNYMDRALKQAHREVEVRNMFCMSSDYLPFMLEGIAAARPAGFELDDFPQWSHTFFDTPDKIPAQWIRQNAMVFSQLIFRLLTDPRPLPVRRKSREEVRNLMVQEGALDAIRQYDFDI